MRAAVAAGTLWTSAETLYLLLLTLVGLPRPKRPSDASPYPQRFAILIPAHDEEVGIGRTLDSCRHQDYPPDLFSIHVVADNCADSTADAVRAHECHVHERTDPLQPGKGPALNWLADRLDAEEVEYDVAVVIDADTTVDSGFLAAIDREVRGGVDVAQGFYSVRDPEASAATMFRFAALACRHHLRPLARCRLGGSSGLYGNGMAFRRAVLSSHRWSAHLVEDAEFQLLLLREGVRVRYVPAARLEAEMPVALHDAVSQNARWERGRIENARRFVPLLCRDLRAPRSRRIAIVDAILDQLLPPLSSLVVLQTSLSLTSSFGVIRGRSFERVAFGANLIGVGVVVFHAIAGLGAVGAPLRHVRSLVSSGPQVLWKARMWGAAVANRREIVWTRTRRNSEA